MTHLTIGEFAQRTRLSPKALRLYGELGLVVPARVDPDSGYRLYDEQQVEQARLVGLLRRLDMPLARIADVLGRDGPDAARAVGEWWAEVEALRNERRGLVAYIQARLRGEDESMYEVEVRRMPERTLLSISRHVDAAGTDAFFHDAFARLKAGGEGVTGVAGAPFLIFYGEVSEDSDGPIELCRPIDGGARSARGSEPGGGIQRRTEPAHDEAFVRLGMKDMGWPAMLPACDALERWTKEHGREPAGPLRQVLIADQRTAGTETPVCDLSVPLR
ncbi:MAG TPA: helix-turn-helix domain-containing protein [Gaiellaceae bacterium]|nr:helix-turn-helix domain-containing protein [Gaiellaceae bacterium]